jgi:soluble lytic murein transglycosylase-like protein
MKIISILFLVLLLNIPAWAQSYSKAPPQIGRLVLKQEYWEYIKEAAQKYKLSPYLIQAVCAIESRYDPYASSGRGRCVGLMQLHQDTARKYGVNPYNPRENIMGGAAVLANLLTRCNGDLSRVLHVYNATCTAAYEREVKKAYYQAMRSGNGLASAPTTPNHRF